MDLLEKSGLHLGESGERKLIVKTLDPGVEILFARPIDIPAYVENGAADIGITGHDMVRERKAAVDEMLDLQFGRARLVLAVMEESPVRPVADLKGARIATEFPIITATFFAEQGITVTIVPVAGACELTPHLGVADAIVDLTSSGHDPPDEPAPDRDRSPRSPSRVIANRTAAGPKRGRLTNSLWRSRVWSGPGDNAT